MTNLEINGKEYELYLGFDFIRYLDKQHEASVDGIALGIGMATLCANLLQSSPMAILDFIQAATCTSASRPTQRDVEEQMGIWMNEGKLEEMHEYFLALLLTSPITSHQAKTMLPKDLITKVTQQKPAKKPTKK